MKKTYLLFLIILLLTGCVQSTEEQGDQPVEEDNVTEEETIDTETNEEEAAEPPKDDKELVLENAEKVIGYLKDQNFKELSTYVHSDKGVLFSPYAFIEDDAVTFKQEDILHFFHFEEEYTWGVRDGSGEPIKLIPSEYYDEFIYDASYHQADEVVYNPEQARGNSIKNIRDKFPDSQVVEYYVKGTEENGNMDWKALNLVFEKNAKDEWKLVAIVHDQWTI
ncbi:hypothetical protein [Bacillus sp. AFS040349]|uniref:hypothetical protein n=1 Tax=Bacillus sp. AFS040349 TaxID=2033502 RepID=UPI000BFD9D65|nr:hypothetical protein [Bacillus sp. AFS040349]PGT79074.1 hypothetical protein COD11_23100 [Bacillus sp. AFS040349]